MAHLKRQAIPRKWPIPRKGTKYVVKPTFDLRKGVPLLLFLRDMIHVARNRKEVKKALNEEKVLLNGNVVRDEKNPVLLLDKVALVSARKFYKLNLSTYGKFVAEEIPQQQADHKIVKVINKKMLKGKKTQLNFLDGKNMLSNMKCNVQDSVIVDFKAKKITKHLPLQEKAKVVVFAGKHAGKRGTITKINSKQKMVELRIDKKTITVLIKQIIVTE